MGGAALRALGTICAGGEEVVGRVVGRGGGVKGTGVVEAVRGVMEGSWEGNVLRECCWVVGNIGGGGRGEVWRVVESGIVSLLVQLMEGGGGEVRREAGWAVGNLLGGGGMGVVARMVEEGVVGGLVNLMGGVGGVGGGGEGVGGWDREAVKLGVEGLGVVLEVGDEEGTRRGWGKKGNWYVGEVEGMGGREALEGVVERGGERGGDEELVGMAEELLERYFGEVDVVEEVGERRREEWEEEEEERWFEERGYRGEGEEGYGYCGNDQNSENYLEEEEGGEGGKGGEKGDCFSFGGSSKQPTTPFIF